MTEQAQQAEQAQQTQHKTFDASGDTAVSYTHLRAHETSGNLVCRLLLEKKST